MRATRSRSCSSSPSITPAARAWIRTLPADALAEFFRGYVRGYDLDALEQLLDARAAESLASGEGSGPAATS
ncbi:hypothetical protein OR221_0481 [Microbacterium laevaniformans OR221]|nr:hypothetical protein OR221_0481 [Microbacterium laevaniformans OR221]